MNDCDHCGEAPAAHTIRYEYVFSDEHVCDACWEAYNDGEPTNGIAGPSDPRWDATRGQ